MLYTVSRTKYGIVVIGSVPKFEFQALINVWAQEYKDQLKLAPDIARRLGYTLVAGADDLLDQWREELGIEQEEVTKDVPDNPTDAVG